MKLFRKEKIGKRTRSSYKIDGSEKDLSALSKKLFGLKGLELNKVIVWLEPEEMMPHEVVKVKNEEEFEKITDKEISLVEFKGKYNGYDVNIIVDYGLSLLTILSCDEKTNESMKDALSWHE